MQLTSCLLYLCSLCVMLKTATGNLQLSENDLKCQNYDNTCHECIQEPGCKWCTKVLHDSLKDHHCFSMISDLTGMCEEVESFRNSDPLILRNDSFTVVDSKTKIDYNNIVQLKPQKIHIKLQKGAPANITTSYKQVKDYPLDLYYLMDLSKSMKEDKETLASLGKTLARTMRKLTSQFKIGFGSFVDKVMLPFVNTHPADLAKPCTDWDCATPFAFRNNLKLIEDDREFVNQVNAAQISSNLDSPEGGFDALMQAMVCEAQIGWRRNVRKIIIFSTDATFHTAGDGKLAGVVLPNDGKCHLNSKGYYDEFNKYDYPSIGQINAVAQEKGINIIFAVKGRNALYQRLSHEIKDSAFGELNSASRNIVDLVEKVYNSITGKVEMTVKSNTHPDSVTVQFFTKCGGSEMRQTSVCSNIQEGSIVSFEVELMVAECPKDGSKTGRVEIGTLQESLTIEIEFMCTCGCEKESHPKYEASSDLCSNNGTLQCGVCSCNEGFYGEKCQCGKNKVVSNTVNDVNKCKRDSSDLICSGKGRCACETCICWKKERHFGKFCECDKVLCRQNINSKIECSGNGRCSCDKCECNPGWEGQFCECRNENYCIHPDGGESCSGNGDCNCGKCECKVPHTGKYCEECPSCGEGKCFEFRDCVQCQVWESGVLAGEGCENCTSGRIPTLKTLDAQLKQYARLCTFEDDNGCQFNFTYKYKEEGYEIFAQDNQKCPPKIEILAVSFQVISGIVAIGVLTLIIWKIVTTIHDKREYERFVLERKNAKWTNAQNPGYIPPTTTVANPTFAAK